MNSKQQLLRNLPAIDRILATPIMVELAGSGCPQVLLTEAAQESVAARRRQLLAGENSADELDLSPEALGRQAAVLAERKRGHSLRHVINATGTLLHTNLGRAPLAPDAFAAIEKVARSYSNLELDLNSGKRGHRYSHIDDLLCRLTGAEAAAVVNNNAGAVLLSLTALARGKEAIVSRGELVEIGGAFRVPDVMEAGGVTLREVGTTNKTHLRDYENAINAETGLLLKVHTSNYRIVGFTSDVAAAEMVALGRQHQIPVMEDLGSGMLFDMTPFGLPREPTVSEGVAAGIDVLTFSGDKLLGGPQAGLIVGRKWAIDIIRHHPLARALRIDKLTLAALEATLRHYLDHAQALGAIPVLQMLAVKPEALAERSQTLADQLTRSCPGLLRATVISEPSRVGGGSLPLVELPGFAVAVQPTSCSVDQLALRLRSGTPPVVGRIQEERLLLNPRTLQKEEEPALVAAVEQALRPSQS